MPVAGDQITIAQALALCYTYGFKFGKLTIAVAVMTAESGRYTRAYHVNDNGSIDIGIWQINSGHGHEEWMDYSPNKSTIYAYALYSKGSNFTPWYAYVNKAHRKYIPAIAIVQAARWSWKKLLPTIADLG